MSVTFLHSHALSMSRRHTTPCGDTQSTYVWIHEGGVKGKLWRQLQAMHGDTNRRVLHPLGLTQPFRVERGVPQGAVESPWVYSQFIDGLTQDLKAAGLGVWITGKQVPLLMYADDMVLLASSVSELRRMMTIATTFSTKNRFQFNGKKSAVMVINAKPHLWVEAAREAWSLAGEAVEIKDKYVYLGTTSTVNDDKDWSAHMRRIISDSEKASAALLRVLRLDKGMRPRTAITLYLEVIGEVQAGVCQRSLEWADIGSPHQGGRVSPAPLHPRRPGPTW